MSLLPQSTQFQPLGTVFSGIAYGIVIVLSGNCFHLLHKKRSIYSNRMRILLFIYVTVMFILSTLTLAQSICQFVVYLNSSLAVTIPNNFVIIPFTYPPTIWGADGFMVRIIILHQEQKFTVQFQMWRCVNLYQDVSKGLILILFSLFSLVSIGMSNFISTLPFKLLLMNNTRLRYPVVHQLCLVLVQLGLRGAAHYIDLHFRQYHTRSVDCFPTHLPSKTPSKCPRSGTWISIYQRYHHVHRILSTDGHFQWPVHHYDFRIPGSVVLPIHDPPSYLCRWLIML